jgi:hypothetical protein
MKKKSEGTKPAPARKSKSPAVPDALETERPAEFSELVELAEKLNDAIRGMGGLALKGDWWATKALKEAVMEGIKILKGSPHTPDLQRNYVAWPSIVPAGPETAPLWKAWMKDEERTRVGANTAVIRKGSLHLENGKAAWLAMQAIDRILPLWREGPHPFENVTEAPSDAKARNLPILTKDSVPDWRELCLSELEAIEPDWLKWLSVLDRNQTAETMNAARKGGASENGIDPGTARSVVSETLRDGLIAIAGSFSKTV